MNLIDRLCNLPNNASVNLSPSDRMTLEYHYVHDLFPADVSRVKVVFLLESPHICEICHDHPLADKSGTKVAEFLLSKNLISETDACDSNSVPVPIGCLVKDESIPWIALMNVSELPLQKESYCVPHCIYSEQLDCLREEMEEIRKNLHRYYPIKKPFSRSTDLRRNIYKMIVSDLKCRIEFITSISRERPMFVPCDYVARNSLCSVQKNGVDLCHTKATVYHPGRSFWNRSKFGQLACELRSRIQQIQV